MRRARPNRHPRWSRSTNYAPVSAKVQRAPTLGPCMGKKLKTAWGGQLSRCGFVSHLVCCSLAPFPPALVVRVCFSCAGPVALLCRCALFRCARLCWPSFSLRSTGTVPRTGRIFGQSTGVLYLATKWRMKEVSIHTENPVACWIEKRSTSSMLDATLQQTVKKTTTNFPCVIDTEAPVACWMLPCSKKEKERYKT